MRVTRVHRDLIVTETRRDSREMHAIPMHGRVESTQGFHLGERHFMRSSTRARVRTGVLSVSTATALAAALAAAPVGAANGSTAAAPTARHAAGVRSTPPASLRPTVVTLVTGDRVVLR